MGFSGEEQEMRSLPQSYSGLKVFVSGHTGFKGTWLVKMLQHLGAKVSGLSLEPPSKPNLFELLDLSSSIDHTIADIRDATVTRETIQRIKPDLVFHLAAQSLVRKSYDQPQETFDTNIMGTVNVLDAIRDIESVRAAVIVTSDKVYKNSGTKRSFSEESELGGNDPYSSSKAAAELVVESYRTSFFNRTARPLVATARAGNVIGGGDWADDRLVPDIIKAVFKEKNLPIIRNPEAVRPWQHVLEPLSGYLKLGAKLLSGDSQFCSAWNFGPKDESAVSVATLTERILSLTQCERFEIQRESIKAEADYLSVESAKARTSLGWNSKFTFDTSIQMTVDWYKTFYSNADVSAFTEKQIADYLS